MATVIDHMLNGSPIRRPVLLGSTIPVIFLVLFYLVSRVPLLVRLPVFVDESIHIQWAHDAIDGDFAAGAWDGKSLSIQIIAWFIHFVPLDELYAARLASVLAGLGTLLTCIAIGTVLFSFRQGFIAGIIYSVLPFALLYNRLALADGFMTLFGALTIWLSIKLVGAERLVHSIVFSILLLSALVATLLAKLSGLALVLVPVATAIILLPPRQWRHGLVRVAPAVGACLLSSAFLYLNDYGFHQIAEKTLTLEEPWWQLVYRNLLKAADWYWYLLTPPIALLFLFVLAWIVLRERSRPLLLLLVICVIVILPYVLLGRIWFPRYILLSVAPLCLIGAHFLDRGVGPFGCGQQRLDKPQHPLGLAWLRSCYGQPM